MIIFSNDLKKKKVLMVCMKYMQVCCHERCFKPKHLDHLLVVGCSIDHKIPHG